VLQEPACYEERYRLTGRVATSLAASLLALGPGVFSSFPLPVRVFYLALGTVLALPYAIGLASRKVAFRADSAGITLGADLAGWPFRRVHAVFIPWADAERIILYPGPGYRWGVECIGVQRRHESPALSARPASAASQGGKPASGCPVSGVAARATRRIVRWGLDRDRLAAVIAASRSRRVS